MPTRKIVELAPELTQKATTTATEAPPATEQSGERQFPPHRSIMNTPDFELREVRDRVQLGGQAICDEAALTCSSKALSEESSGL